MNRTFVLAFWQVGIIALIGFCGVARAQAVDDAVALKKKIAATEKEIHEQRTLLAKIKSASAATKDSEKALAKEEKDLGKKIKSIQKEASSANTQLNYFTDYNKSLAKFNKARKKLWDARAKAVKRATIKNKSYGKLRGETIQWRREATFSSLMGQPNKEAISKATDLQRKLEVAEESVLLADKNYMKARKNYTKAEETFTSVGVKAIETLTGLFDLMPDLEKPSLQPLIDYPKNLDEFLKRRRALQHEEETLDLKKKEIQKSSAKSKKAVRELQTKLRKLEAEGA